MNTSLFFWIIAGIVWLVLAVMLLIPVICLLVIKAIAGAIADFIVENITYYASVISSELEERTR